MEPKAFLSETAAKLEFYMASAVAQLWMPHFLLSAGQLTSKFLSQEPLSPSSASNYSWSSHPYRRVMEVKGVKKEEIFTWIPKKLGYKSEGLATSACIKCLGAHVHHT